jgi:3-isopropylmalate/(R)-2-methylmalate dehydratase large subunit
VRLVIAEASSASTGRTPTTSASSRPTDFRLVDRIERGEDDPARGLLAGRDALAAAILRSGGLLNYGRTFVARTARWRRWSGPMSPQTLFEK